MAGWCKRSGKPNPPDTDSVTARGTGALVASSAGGSSTGRHENGIVVFHSATCTNFDISRTDLVVRGNFEAGNLEDSTKLLFLLLNSIV